MKIFSKTQQTIILSAKEQLEKKLPLLIDREDIMKEVEEMIECADEGDKNLSSKVKKYVEDRIFDMLCSDDEDYDDEDFFSH